MNTEQKLVKVWQTPQLIIFNSNFIASGNPADPRKGEFLAYTGGTGCPSSIINLSCVTSSSYILFSYSTGQNSTQMLCFNDPQTMTYFIPICS